MKKIEFTESDKGFGFKSRHQGMVLSTAYLWASYRSKATFADPDPLRRHLQPPQRRPEALDDHRAERGVLDVEDVRQERSHEANEVVGQRHVELQLVAALVELLDLLRGVDGLLDEVVRHGLVAVDDHVVQLLRFTAEAAQRLGGVLLPVHLEAVVDGAVHELHALDAVDPQALDLLVVEGSPIR